MIKVINKKVYFSKLKFNGTLCHKFYADDLIMAYGKKWF